MTTKNGATPLTEAMIASFPAIDPHVHVPGSISPQTAWDLGLRNRLIHMERDDEGRWLVADGPNQLGASDPVKLYSRLFTSRGGHELTFDKDGNPIDLDYDYHCLADKRDVFSGFDAIQGTTQGHRHRPGGIQNEDDYRFVMRRYLESCLKQNIHYVEPSQNITIAQMVLYPTLTPKDARTKFYALAKEIIAEFANAGVTLRFTHCANKTGSANIAKDLKVRANEWADWLEEAHRESPGVFVGLTTAGHEKGEIEAGGPRALVEAYERVAALGLGCEGHYGEGAGVEHMMKAVELLPENTRFSHGYQVIESQDAIDAMRATGKPLIMSPCINVNLGGVIHLKDGKPHAKLQHDPITKKLIIDETTGKPLRVEGIENHYIESLEDHPIWTLMRDHHLPIGLMSDDPQQGGIDYKDQARLMAGIPVAHLPNFRPVARPGFQRLTAEEFTRCNLHALQVAFCEPEAKKALATTIAKWMNAHTITVAHPLLP